MKKNREIERKKERERARKRERERERQRERDRDSEDLAKAFIFISTSIFETRIKSVCARMRIDGLLPRKIYYRILSLIIF